MKSKWPPGSRDQEVKDVEVRRSSSSSRTVPVASLTGGSQWENNPMIAAAWEETGDATQAHRSAALVAAGDSRFPRTGGCCCPPPPQRKDRWPEEEVTLET